MDDETILQRGGTEEDIKNYAEQNGADVLMPLTQHIEEIEKKFVEKLLNEWVNQIDLDDINSAKSFLRQSILSTLQAVKESLPKNSIMTKMKRTLKKDGTPIATKSSQS